MAGSALLLVPQGRPSGELPVAPSPAPTYLCDLKAALHDHQTLPPAASSQQLLWRVAAPLCEQLARSSCGWQGQHLSTNLPSSLIYLPIVALTLASFPTPAGARAGPRVWPEPRRGCGKAGQGWPWLPSSSPHLCSRHSPYPRGCTPCSSSLGPSCSDWLVGKGHRHMGGVPCHLPSSPERAGVPSPFREQKRDHGF